MKNFEFNKIIIFLIVLGVIVFAGCDNNPTGEFVENFPPETRIIGTGALPDTSDPSLFVAWSGSDQDGEVVGFEIAFDDTSQWQFTTATRDTFIIANMDSLFTRTTFYARAIDDADARDPTPAVQPFQVFNAAPTVRLNFDLSPPRVVLNVISIFWDPGEDPDPGGGIAGYEYKFDTDTEFTSVPANQLSVTKTDLVPGERVFTLRARDIGGGLSEPNEFAFTSQSVQGEILVIDDASEALNGGVSADNTYLSIFQSLFPGNFTVYDINEFFPAFVEDFDRVVNENEFRAVFWYTGNVTHFSQGEPSIRKFLNEGNGLMLSAPSAANAGGGFTDDFRRNFLYIDGISRKTELNPGDENFFYTVSRTSDDIVSDIPEIYPTLDFSPRVIFVQFIDGVLVGEAGQPVYRLPNFILNREVIISATGNSPKTFFISIPLHLADGAGNLSELFEQVMVNDFGVSR